jgi:hypothetical protein
LSGFKLGPLCDFHFFISNVSGAISRRTKNTFERRPPAAAVLTTDGLTTDGLAISAEVST